METPAEIKSGVAEAPEGGFDARALGLRAFAQGENRDDLKAIVDAVLCYFGDGDV